MAGNLLVMYLAVRQNLRIKGAVGVASLMCGLPPIFSVKQFSHYITYILVGCLLNRYSN